MDVKVFRVLREENYKTDMMAKLVASGMAEMPMNILVEMAETLYIKRVMISTIEEKEDW